MRAKPLLAAGLLLAASASPARARAEGTAGDCADAYEQAQRHQRAGRLRSALKSAVACASESCPVILRRECTEWIAPLRANIPSISVRVRGKNGCDRSEATIAIDGDVVATSADGSAIDVDPGRRVLRVTIDGAPPYEENLVAAQGERARQVVVSFAPAGAVCGARPPPPSTRPRDAVETSRPVPPLVIVLGGLGIAGLGVSGGFGIAGFSKKSDLEACKPACSPTDTDSMRTSFTISDVALGISVVSLGIATVLYLTR